MIIGVTCEKGHVKWWTFIRKNTIFSDGGILFAEKIGNRDYMLTLESVTLEDDAEYVVIARNATGEARSTAQLLVEALGELLYYINL